jgi:ribulose-5-phosphate 4-epimerase/fuculose-1-phosphate aldolase
MSRTSISRHALATLAACLLPIGLACAAPDLQNPQVKAVVDDLVVANHILFQQGVVDGFGHISARNPLDPAHFFMARSVAPGVAVAGDIMEFDLDGNVVGDPSRNDPRGIYSERYIHSEIYKVRPDVTSVVHGHSPSVIPFSVAHVALRPMFHMAGFLGAGTPFFEIRDTAGADAPDTDMLVKTPRLGAGLARALGKSNVVLMRGHGFTAVAPSVQVAVFRSIYTEQNARMQSEALKLGRPQYLTVEEAAQAQASTERSSGRPWEMWKAQAAGK